MHVVVSQILCVEAKEVVVEGFLRPPFLGSTNSSASTVNAEAVVMGC